MKITSLTLQNFKAIGPEPQRIHFAPITLLFGPNSAGKSTILQALVYLREILIHRNLDPDVTELGGDWLDLGGFENLVHAHNLDNRVSLKLEMSVGLDAEYLNLFNDDVHNRWASADFDIASFFEEIETISLCVVIAWSAQKRRAFCSNFEIEINSDFLLSIEANEDGNNVFINNLNLKHKLLVANESAENESLPCFSRLFSEIVKLDKVQVDSLDTFGDVNEERPFLRHRLPDLAELVASLSTDNPIEALSSAALLRKIRDELVQRDQRSALVLKLKIDETLANLPEINEVTKATRINIYDMSDALPHSLEYLHFDEEIWLESEEANVDEKRFVEYLLSTLIVGTFQTARKMLSRLTYLGPLRQLPARQYSPQKTPSISKWSSGLAAWEALHAADNKFVQELNDWLGDNRLKTGYEVQVSKYREVDVSHPLIRYLEQQADAEQQALVADLIQALPIKTRVALKEARTGLEVMAQDVGVGISQLLPVVVASMKQKGGLIAIEQPELHVHPAIQVELGDLFASYALGGEKSFLLETHSEHLLLRLLRRIRESSENERNLDQEAQEKTFTRELLSIVYLESDEYGLKVTNIELDEEGEFVTRWPRGFFVERRQELM